MIKKLIVIVSVLLGITIAAGVYLIVDGINKANRIQEAEEHDVVLICGTPYIMEQYEKRQRQTFRREPGVLTCGEYEYMLLEDGTAEIVNYHGKRSEITIPVSLNGNKVTVIGENAFFHPFVTNAEPEAKPKDESSGSDESGPEPPAILEPRPSTYEGPTKIVIPEGVTTIRKGAFSLCEGLVSVSLPDSLTLIEDGAFDGCSRLAEIHVSPDHPVFAVVGGALIDWTNHRPVCELCRDAASFSGVSQGTEKNGGKAFCNAQIIRILCG